MARRPVPEPAEHRPWGDPGASWDPGPPPNNHMAWALVTTIICCVPVGLVAVWFAGQVRPKWESGDYYGAAEAATRAKTWGWVAISVGFFVYVVLGAALVAARSAAP